MNKSEKYFNLISHAYDKATENPGAWNPPDIIYKYIKKELTINSVILDIGIGTGQSIKEIGSLCVSDW